MKNANTNHTSFKLNYGYHPQASCKKDVNPCSWWKSIDQLATKLRELMIFSRKIFQHRQKFQKWYHNKYIKLRSFAPDKKVWLNSKYIKTK